MSQQLGVGTFSNYENTECALGELKTTGFQMNRISVVGRDIHDQTDMAGVNTTDRLSDVESNLPSDANKAAEKAKDGAIAGGAIGGSAGLLVGLGLLAVPGFGPVLLAGAAATAIATAISGGAIGAAAGGLVGGLVGLGIPEDQAKIYSDRIDQGDYLVILEGSDAEISSADNIFDQYHINDWHVYDLPNDADTNDAYANRANGNDAYTNGANGNDTYANRADANDVYANDGDAVQTVPPTVIPQGQR